MKMLYGKQVVTKPQQVSSVIRPEETEPHLHPCSVCSEPYECWCAFPDVHLQDDMARCPECQGQ